MAATGIERAPYVIARARDVFGALPRPSLARAPSVTHGAEVAISVIRVAEDPLSMIAVSARALLVSVSAKGALVGLPMDGRVVLRHPTRQGHPLMATS